VCGETPSIFIADGVDKVHHLVYVLFFLRIYERKQSGVFKLVAARKIRTLINTSVTGCPEQLEIAVTKCFGVFILAVLVPHCVKKISASFIKIVFADFLPELFVVGSFK
jgi:hypothetical protein